MVSEAQKPEPIEARSPHRPKLTIITIVWNARSSFHATAKSVLQEWQGDWEWVVVDGASTDGTLDEIKKFSTHIARFLSEKDRGIADAFNKGIRLAKGDYVLFLNAGDQFMQGIGTDISSCLSEHAQAPVIVGRIEMSGRQHGKKVPFWRQYMRNHLPHQAMFIRQSLFQTYGMFDENRRLGMDFEWSLRLQSEWKNIVFVPNVITNMEPGGVSMSNSGKTFEAYHAARVQHFDKAFVSHSVLVYYQLKRVLLKPFRPMISWIRKL